MKSVLCIGGTDPSGGAGLAADIKTLSALNVHAYSVVAAVTAQNSRRFDSMQTLSTEDIRQQMHLVLEESKPDVIKIGFVPNREILYAIFDEISGLDGFVVFDPVLKTSSGFELSLSKTDILEILPRVDLLTPNRYEFEQIFGEKVSLRTAIEAGAKSVVLKGGDQKSCDQPSDCLRSDCLRSDAATDIWTDGQTSFEIHGVRTRQTSRGTGCTFASAFAAHYTRLGDVAESVVLAKAFVSQSLVGERYLEYSHWPVGNKSFPWIGKRQAEGFKDCGEEPLGFYPVVDSADWVEKLVKLGVRTIQLRLKVAPGEESNSLGQSFVEQEIVRSINAAAKKTRLFINDYWQLAVKHGAYGVHLGQEDILTADIDQIRQAGLRLGVSTHSYEELARAHALRPSYVALGPVYETTAKVMPWKPQGLDRVNLWSQLVPYPLVAIGGMTVDRGCLAYQAGASSVAVMSDVTNTKEDIELSKKITEWLNVSKI